MDLPFSSDTKSFGKPDMSWANNCPNGNKSTLFSSTL